MEINIVSQLNCDITELSEQEMVEQNGGLLIVNPSIAADFASSFVEGFKTGFGTWRSFVEKNL